MALLIKNGEIITADSRYVADIYVENQTITQIGVNLETPPDTEVIDATGKFVFPGFIDPHVHIYLPFMGTFSKDDYATGSKAGGLAMPRTTRTGQSRAAPLTTPGPVDRGLGRAAPALTASTQVAVPATRTRPAT